MVLQYWREQFLDLKTSKVASALDKALRALIAPHATLRTPTYGEKPVPTPYVHSTSLPSLLETYGNDSSRQELIGRAARYEEDLGEEVTGITVDKLVELFTQEMIKYPDSVFRIKSWLHSHGYDDRLQPAFHTSFEQVLEVIRSGWNREETRELMSLLHSLGDRSGEGHLLRVVPTLLTFKADDLISYPVLSSLKPALTLPVLRLRFAFLRQFNLLLANLLSLVDLRRTSEYGTIAGLVRSARPFIFDGVRSDFFERILDSTADDNTAAAPSIKIERIALHQRRQRGEVLDLTQHSLFASAYRQLHDVDWSKMRRSRPQGTTPFFAIEVVFKGEQVVGEGGPYRQFFTDVGRELQDETYRSPLFVPCPNKENNIGDNRDKFVIRPSAASSVMLQMFEFLGMLFGCCIRTGVRFPLDLPAFVWKPLVGDPLVRADLADIDKAAVESLVFVETCDEEMFNSNFSEMFTTKLSDKSVTELKQSGASIKVEYQNREEWVKLVLAARLSEHKQQIDAIRKGIGAIVPLHLLNLLTWTDLEMLVCGKPTIDIDLLRRHTQYDDSITDSPHIETFWRVLNSFDQAHRRMFIRFAWAQERLPADDVEFIRSHTRLLIKPPAKSYADPDIALPRSDTCFFNLELPAYSTEEIMRSKILYAISNVISMNADEHVEDIHGAQGAPRNRFGGGLFD